MDLSMTIWVYTPIVRPEPHCCVQYEYPTMSYPTMYPKYSWFQCDSQIQIILVYISISPVLSTNTPWETVSPGKSPSLSVRKNHGKPSITQWAMASIAMLAMLVITRGYPKRWFWRPFGPALSLMVTAVLELAGKVNGRGRLTNFTTKARVV